MKKNLLYIVLMGVIGLFIQSCQSDPVFPDPGFELTDQRVEVRRDTADYYDIKMNMKVPNKVKEILVLNGLDYSVIEKVDGYAGKTNFLFDYRVDLTAIEENTVLNYIIKVTDLDGRSFNRGIRISVKRFSFPEIKLTGGTSISVAAPAYYVKGQVSTGLNTIASIKVMFQGVEQFSYTPAVGEALHEMPLKALVFFGNLDPNLQYPINIIIKDDQGQESTTVITVRKSNIVKKPYRINYRNPANILINITPTYDAEGKITAFDYYWTTTLRNYRQEFKYNDLGMVNQIKYIAIESNGVVSSETNIYINYVPGTKKILDVKNDQYTYNTDGSIAYRDLAIETSAWTYDSTDKVLSFKTSTGSTVSNVFYSDPFGLGENVFGEYWQTDSYITQASRRQNRSEYDPILIPTFMEGLPVYFKANGVPSTVYNDLFQCKYLPITTVTTSASPLNGPDKPTYVYETDDAGNLTNIYKTNYFSNKSETYSFFYD